MPHETPENESVDLNALFEKYNRPEDIEIIVKLKKLRGEQFQSMYGEWVEKLMEELDKVQKETKDQHKEHIELIKMGVRKGVVLYNIEYYTECLAELRATMEQLWQLNEEKLHEENELEKELFTFGTHVRGKVDAINELG